MGLILLIFFIVIRCDLASGAMGEEEKLSFVSVRSESGQVSPSEGGYRGEAGRLWLSYIRFVKWSLYRYNYYL